MDFEKINADDTLNQGRIKINNILDAAESQVNELKNDIVHTTPDMTEYIKGNCLFKGVNKRFTRSFGATDINNRIWDFTEWTGKINIEHGKPLKIYNKSRMKNVSGKLKSYKIQYRWYKTGEESYVETTYSHDLQNHVFLQIESPNEEYTSFDMVIYEELTSANGEAFTDILDIDMFMVFDDFEFDPNFISDVDDYNNCVDANKKLTLTNTMFSFLQGNIVNGVPNSALTTIRTELISIDFYKAIFKCYNTDNLSVAVHVYGKDKSYIRYVQDYNAVEFVPNSDEYYYALTIGKPNYTLYVTAFDEKRVSVERFSYNDLLSEINDNHINQNAMFYQDRISNKNGSYWIINKKSDGTKEHYVQKRIRDVESVNGVPTIFITDTHWRTNSSSNYSWDLCGIFASICNCRNVVFGGDALTQHETKEEGLFQLINEIHPFTMRFGKDFKYVFGNHDANLANVGSGIFTEDASVYRISYENIYKVGFQHLKNVVNFEKTTTNKNTEEWYRNRLHYYYDDVKNKIRYIVMDSGTRYDALENGGTPTRLRYQYNWLKDVLIDTPVGYHIMVFAHQFWGGDVSDTNNPQLVNTNQGDNVSKILKAYMDKSTIHIGATTEGGNTYNFDFTNSNGCPIIAMVSGHVHFDYQGVINGINQIITSCDAVDHTSHYGIDMEVNTITEHAFDIIKVDKFKRKVKVFRIGAGGDREFTY